MMTTTAASSVCFLIGSPFKRVEWQHGHRQHSANSSFAWTSTSRVNVNVNVNVPRRLSSAAVKKAKPLKVHARASGSDGPSSITTFVGGFVLGGIIVGALGCVFAPQISKALAGADRKDLMRKLPKFIYDEEKALEKNRQKLTQKIDELNAAIDEISARIHTEDDSKGSGVNSEANAV